jgi:hypothetical protein
VGKLRKYFETSSIQVRVFMPKIKHHTIQVSLMIFVTANQGMEFQKNNCVDQSEKRNFRTRKGQTVNVRKFVIVPVRICS